VLQVGSVGYCVATANSPAIPGRKRQRTWGGEGVGGGMVGDVEGEEEEEDEEERWGQGWRRGGGADARNTNNQR
jgi:hypothetical protein